MRLLKLSLVGAATLAVILVANHRTEPAPVTVRPAIRPVGDRIEDRYLELLKIHLTRYDYENYEEPGRNWPKTTAETMINLERLDNLQACIRDVIERGVPGDLIECGVWRGGATIFMRAALKAYRDEGRTVWVADSFEGLPKPSNLNDKAGFIFWKRKDVFMVSLEEVQRNFQRYGLLDERVKFLKGWFKDTLPGAPIERLAILRADGDLYESTMQTLEPLYDKVSPGGYVIVDDYFSLPESRRATDDFRRKRGISEPIKQIDWTGAYWRKG